MGDVRDAFRGGAALLALIAAVALQAVPCGAQQRASRAGRVLDAATGRPLAGAVITAGRASTVTESDGTFSIRVPEGAEEVRAERIGYATVVVRLSAWSGVIPMEPVPYLLERLAVEVGRTDALAAGTALAVARADRAHIDASGATSVADALRGIEGVEDARVGSWGSRPVIRGLTGERIAVLIDGNRVNRACTFGMDQGLASVDPAQVERVEVLAGPGSTLYGSGSLGGVVNVVTRHAEEIPGRGGEVRGGGSSAVPGGSAGASVWTGTERIALSLAADASWYGDYHVPGGTVDGSSYRQWTGDGKVDLRPASGHLVSLKGQRYEGRDIGWPMMRGAKIPREDRTSLSIDYGWQAGRGIAESASLKVFRQRLDHHMTMEAVMIGPMGAMTTSADAVSHSTTSGARGQLRLAPSTGVRADLGAEVSRWFAEGTRWNESGPSASTFHTWPGVAITDVGAFLQGETRIIDVVFASLGARVDRVRRKAEDAASVAETVATGNAGVRVDLGRGVRARASLGAGYRTPDPTELYGLALRPDGFVYRGRADLPTERSLDREVTLTWSGPRAETAVTLFHNRLTDMISPVLVPGDTVAGRPVREYRALSSATIEGVSGSATLTMSRSLEARATGSWTRGSRGGTGEPLPAMPPLAGALSLRRGFAATPLRWLELEVSGSSDQERISTAAGETATPGYGVVDVRWLLEAAGVRATAGVENLLDRTYRSHLDPVSLFRPGRNVFVRVSRRF